MPLVRVPLGASISTRNSSIQSDALLRNCFPATEPSGRTSAYRRFGYNVYSTQTAGTALGLFTFNNTPLAAIGSTLYLNGSSIGTINSGSSYQFSEITQGTKFFIKNNTNAYFYNGSLTAVTDPDYPANTVPGVVTLDTTTYVMNTASRIYGSALDDPTTWTALNFVSANVVPDAPVALSRLYNYVVAFLETSTELFYDNANATGSPLSPYTSSVINVGCASAASVVATKNTIFWIGKTHQKGRSVYLFDGLNPRAISTPPIDRILNADPLTNVASFFIEIEGHAFYVLTLKTSNITLVYDVVSNQWHVWSSTSLGAPVRVQSFTFINGILTLVIPNHGILPGDVVNVTGVAQTPFLGDRVPTIVDSNTISYPVFGGASGGGIDSAEIDALEINGDIPNGFGLSTPIGPLFVALYRQNYFRSVFYTPLSNSDLLLDETTGTIYSVLEGVSSDNGMFIRTEFSTDALDFGDNTKKFFPKLEVIADKNPTVAFINYTDNDFVSFSNVRPVNLGAERSQLRRLSASRRRGFRVLYIGPFRMRFFELEVQIEKSLQ